MCPRHADASFGHAPRVRIPRWASALVLVLVLAAPCTAQAAVPEPASVTIVSETGDQIGAGADRLFAAAHAVAVTGTRAHLRVEVKYQGEWFTFNFAPPPKQRLADGEYAGAEGYPVNVPWTPAISVSGNGRGCDHYYGRFDIRDVAFKPNGEVERLWALYEQHCGDPNAPGLFGEIRAGEPTSTAPESTFPGAITWPPTSVGATSVTVPVAVVGESAQAQIASVSIQGEAAGDFSITSDGCTGVALQPSNECQLGVDVTPTEPGLRTAQLVISDMSGAQTLVALEVNQPPPPPPPLGNADASVFSEPEDGLAHGTSRVFAEAHTVTMRGQAQSVEVRAVGEGANASFQFVAPAGERLEPGEYVGAERAFLQRSGAPGLSVGYGDSGCNRDYGRFVVKEIHITPLGKVTRFWALYEQSCESPVAPPVFGEVRVGYPAAAGPEIVAPAAVEWPRMRAGATGRAVPVEVGAGEAGGHITAIHIEGPDAGDFTVSEDTCSGAMLAPRARCGLAVEPRATAGGMRTAQLVLVDQTGAISKVALRVDAEPMLQISSVALVSEPGDWIGGGTDRLFDASRTVTMTGDSSHLEVSVASEGERFKFEVAPPAGEALAPGEQAGAERYGFQAAGAPGLSVTGDGRGCNRDYGRFIVKDIHFDAAGGVDRFWALYEQHCESPAAPALFGEVRIGESAPPAPYAVVPTAVEWPRTAVGSSSVGVPLEVVGGEAGATITSVAVEGEDAEDFSVTDDECAGATLAPDATCELSVAAHPIAAGTRTAQLLITEASGHNTTVPLAVSGF